jgi:D-beta-D-heptose 7-phosphate kinase/D-beta-D-heptose 1-phosphate adenosyltransferase
MMHHHDRRPIAFRRRVPTAAPAHDVAPAHDLLHKFDALPHPRLLVLGDLILDRYTWGDAERVSQEAPVVVLKADQQEVRPGGAANVALLLRGLEAHVTCCGVLGGDADGHRLRELLVEAHIDTDGLIVDAARPTTVKHRFVGRAAGRHPHQIVQVDHESRAPLSAALE